MTDSLTYRANGKEIRMAEYDRKRMENMILRPLEEILTEEQYQRGKKYLQGLTDEQLFGMLVDKAGAHLNTELTLKDYLMHEIEVREAIGTTWENTAFRNREVQFLDAENDRKYKDIILHSFPTDRIRLTGKQDSMLIDLKKKDGQSRYMGFAQSRPICFLLEQFLFMIVRLLLTKVT